MQDLIAAPDSRLAIDPITLEVIRHRLVSITNQIDANIKCTAFSPYIYEYNDFAVGLTGAQGQLVAQCTGGMPPFVADSVGMAVRDGLSIYGAERLHHGDVVVCNHAAVQGQHLNNTVMYTPIYAGARRESLIGFFAINVHWIEIGGIQTGSTDIFMEGLQLRSIKLWSRGEPIEEVYRIIENNTRLAVELMGDPRVPIKVKVIVAGAELTVDYSELAGQAKGPINSGYFGGGQTTARVAFKYLLGAAEMANEGTFRPIKLILPPGKLLSADPSAPMFMYPTPFPTVIDAIIKALENALPARVPGGHLGTHSGVRFYGRRPNGSFFDSHDSGHGGWGACATHDGAGPFRTMAHADTRIIPLELQEAILPFRIEEFALRQDSAGPGTFRGGLGFRKAYRILAPCNLQTNLDRTLCPPWGVQGGADAQPGRFTLRKAGSETPESV